MGEGLYEKLLNLREISLLSSKKCSLVEEEREDVEKKVGEALDKNLGFARKSAKLSFYF